MHTYIEIVSTHFEAFGPLGIVEDFLIRSNNDIDVVQRIYIQRLRWLNLIEELIMLIVGSDVEIIANSQCTKVYHIRLRRLWENEI